MKKITLFLVVFLSIFFWSFTKNQSSVPLTEVVVKAPFEMPAIKIPDFSKCKKFSIVEFGAVSGDKVTISNAITKTIAKANKIGGGIVVIPMGEWLTGKIHFKSNLNLHLDKGAVLLFFEDTNDHLPDVNSTWEGYECLNYSPLVYAYQCKNIAIIGEGELKVKMDVWKEWFKRPKAHMESLKWLYYLASYDKPMKEQLMVNDSAHLRPQFIQFNRCTTILMDGISITSNPFWTIHPFLSKDVWICKKYLHE